MLRHAARDLPLWFREGLIGYIEGEAQGTAAPPSDAELRQTGDEARAARAYRDAAGAVAALARRYGEGTVFGWVKGGLPPEVKNASSKQLPTKSK